ncbi:serine/threonine-protein kinase [Streptomyces sp. WAC01280]|uniref:serine/threonine-protein kinase n=1 Tax=Streptomyces sp. WAC01280 TaxID=2487424 RepID=UPI000F7713E3|nr:serine/threonine-protein kinase [Streptomyces sp. WAC01280]RSS56697.1 serine/threonine protein kinase [Streptomyces sp. WAC01280]
MSSGENERLAGRYRIVRRLGRGGMGVVWRAVDEVLGREVAVKELRTFTDAAAPELADLRLRMTREARAAARVRHPGVVAVHDVTEHEGRPVIVMELVDGPSLDDVLGERGTLDPVEAARIGAHVLEALAAAHDVGVLHRDVKPGNILLDRSGRIVLTDFGIATMEDPGDGSATHLTRSGEIVGSLDFLAPERARGQDPGPASDVWAVGATLYAAVEGASPFRRTSTWSTLAAIVGEPLPEPVRAGPLAPVLTRLLDKDPASRPGAREAARLLGAVAESVVEAEAVPVPVPESVVEAEAEAGPGPVSGAEAGPPAAPVEGFGPPVMPVAPLAPPAPVMAAGPVPPVLSGPDTVGASGRRARAGRRGAAKRRRGSALVAASVAAVLLAGGGLTYVLMEHGTTERASEGNLAGGGPSDVPDKDAGRVLDPGSSGTPSSGATGGTGVPSPTGSGGASPSGRESGEPGDDRGPATDGTGHDGSEPGDGSSTGTGTSTRDTAAGAGGGDGSGSASGGGSATGGTTAPSSPGNGTATTDAPSQGGAGGGGTTAPATEAPAPAGCESAGSSSTCQVVRSATTTRYDGGEMGTVGAGPHVLYCQVDLDRSETYGGRTSRWFARTDDDSGNTNVYLSVLHLAGGASGGPVEGLRIC